MRRLSILLFLCMLLPMRAALTVVPTFENCSYYYPVTTTYSFDKCWDTGDVCRISYRLQSESEWYAAMSPIYEYDKFRDVTEFRGSLMNLTENSAYCLRIELFENSRWTVKEETTFTTWSSNPPIASTVNLSSLSYIPNRGVTLSGLKGSASGWIKVVGDVPINAGKTADQALLITNCQYVIFEDFKVTGGTLHGIDIHESCSNVRIRRADVSKWGRVPVDQVYLDDKTHYSQYTADDACYIDEKGKVIRNDAGIRFINTVYTGKPIPTANNLVIEYCYVHDPNGNANAWYGVRDLGWGRGTSYRFMHPQGAQGLYVKSKGSSVVRYCDVIGSDNHRFNDCIGGLDNGKEYGGFYRDSDVYGCYFAYAQDDGVELDAQQKNLRFYGNRIEQMKSGVSVAPCLTGPSYMVRNVVHNLGDSYQDATSAFKNGGGTTYATGLMIYLNNTTYIVGNGIAGVGYGSDSNGSMFQGFSRNNLLGSTVASTGGGGYGVNEVYSHRNNSFDYDFFFNTVNAGMKGSFRCATPNQELNSLKGSARMSAPNDGLFTLETGSPAIGKGEVIPNIINDRSADRPDMGAIPVGGSSLIPIRPLAVEADKYLLRIHPQGRARLILRAGEMDETLSFVIQKDLEMGWLQIETSDSSLGANETQTLDLIASNSTSTVKRGTLFVRFTNGLSIPVSIVTDCSMPSDIEEGVFSERIPCVYSEGRGIVVESIFRQQYSLYNNFGQKVGNGKLQSGRNTIAVSIPKGVYTICLRDEDSQIYRVKIFFP